jgi:hypothetical protein
MELERPFYGLLEHKHLPQLTLRQVLFALHLPNPDRVQANYAVLAELSRGLSGGDILSVCVNSIHVGSTDDDPA